MATPQTQPTPALQITRTFAAPRERVFRAWTDVKQFAQWFAPSTDYHSVISEFDVRAGGSYKLEMHHKGGNVHKLWGTYREIKPPEKLVFTWSWVGKADPVESVVTIEFRDLGGSTEVLLTHEHLPSSEEREKHGQGWNGCLGQLANFLS